MFNRSVPLGICDQRLRSSWRCAASVIRTAKHRPPTPCSRPVATCSACVGPLREPRGGQTAGTALQTPLVRQAPTDREHGASVVAVAAYIMLTVQRAMREAAFCSDCACFVAPVPGHVKWAPMGCRGRFFARASRSLTKYGSIWTNLRTLAQTLS